MQIEPGPKKYERYEYVEPSEGPHRTNPLFSTRSAITVERVVRFIIALLFVVAAGALIWYFWDLVIYLIIGLVIAYILRPLVDRIQGFGVSRVPSILICFVLVFGIVSILMTFLVQS